MELGLGFMPFLAYTEEESNGLAEIPDFNLIRNSIGECFNSTHLVKMRKKYSTWQAAMDLGTWDEQGPKYLWPSYSSNTTTYEEQCRINKYIT